MRRWMSGHGLSTVMSSRRGGMPDGWKMPCPLWEPGFLKRGASALAQGHNVLLS